MTKRLIIHVGPHKTGTTAIQKMLYTTSRSENSSFIYPFANSDNQGQHAFADVILNSDQLGLNALLSKLTHSDKPCVLSSEEFCYLPLSVLNNFRSALGNIDVDVVYYARNFLTTLYPWWQEQVKHGSLKTFLELSLECLAHPGSIHLLSPDAMLSGWADAFGKDAIKIYLYDDIPDVAAQFSLDILKSALPADYSTETNVSYNYIASEMIRFWNSLGARGADLIQLPQSYELQTEISREARPLSKHFCLSYRIPCFAMIEETLLARWRNQISGTVDPHLFKTRECSYSYMHPDFWVVRPDLTTRMCALASQSLGGQR